ncbi:RNA polymerase sigma-70 factor [Chitinophaga alhagiae]|uniref:RNA polymerase sigma-70 factor n=1 Tax=Chitinophaga alhagiae TaxID=2203219 RepID=UPI000E5AAC13|nr:RNA polymerase sigma-70 factor [Chitinophaga alhagiae]
MQHPEDDGLMKPTAQVFHEYYSALVGYACKFVDLHTAEDLVQDVFIQAHGKLPINPRGYLFRSVHNKCMDYFKHQQVHRRFVQDALLTQQELAYFHPETGHKSLLEASDERSVWEAIEQLPPKCREIIRLRYLEGLKTAEISDAMGISSRTVETQLYKAIKQLRSMFGKINLLFLNFF